MIELAKWLKQRKYAKKKTWTSLSEFLRTFSKPLKVVQHDKYGFKRTFFFFFIVIWVVHNKTSMHMSKSLHYVVDIDRNQ